MKDKSTMTGQIANEVVFVLFRGIGDFRSWGSRRECRRW